MKIGLVHSAFTILNEGHIQNSPYLAKHIPRGELVDLLGKALLYLEVEAHWRADVITTDCKVGFSLLEPHICSSDVNTMKSHVAPSTAHATVAAPSSSMPQPQASTSSLPPPSASAKVALSSSKPPSSASQYAQSQAPPSETGNKRKSSPVVVDVPTEKRQRTEPQASTSQSVSGPYRVFSSLQPILTLYIGIVARNGQMTRSKKKPAHGPGDDETDPRSVRMLAGHSTEVCHRQHRLYRPIDHV